MAFIGNTYTTQGFIPAIDYFNGNGSTTAFTLSRPVASVAQVQAVIENVPQNPGSAYTVSGNTITFTSAPPSGTSNIYVYYTSPITQVIAPGQGTVTTTSLGNITNIASGNSSLTLQTGTTPTTAMTIDTSQNVGIGTTSPTNVANYKSVTISGTTGSILDLQSNGVFAGRVFSNATTLGIEQGNASGLIYFGTTGTERMRIDSSGNVGIGASSPAASLSITKQSTALSGTGNSFGVYLYPTSTGQCWLDGVTNSSSNTSMGIRSYNNGTYYTANLDNSGNFQFNSGYGSTATAYGCRAWVNFNGTGTVAIRASGNVSSITDNGTGDYTVNFTNAMPDANYSAVGSSRQLTASGYLSVPTDVGTGGTNFTRTTSAYQIQCANVVGGLNDNPWLSIAIFR